MSNTSILLVGYSVAAKEDLSGLVSDWPADASADAAEAAIELVKSDRAEMRAKIASDPSVHLCQLSRVVIVDPQREQLFDSAAHSEPAVVKTAGFLMDLYPDAWGKTPFDYRAGPPAVSFYGFDMRLFLKLLGLGAAEQLCPLPAGLWYTNTDHRDMEGALLPAGCTAKKFQLMHALRSLNLAEPLGLAPTWTPRVDPLLDTRVASEIAQRLGLLLVKKDPKLTKPTKTKGK